MHQLIFRNLKSSLNAIRFFKDDWTDLRIFRDCGTLTKLALEVCQRSFGSVGVMDIFIAVIGIGVGVLVKSLACFGLQSTNLEPLRIQILGRDMIKNCYTLSKPHDPALQLWLKHNLQNEKGKV